MMNCMQVSDMLCMNNVLDDGKLHMYDGMLDPKNAIDMLKMYALNLTQFTHWSKKTQENCI